MNVNVNVTRRWGGVFVSTGSGADNFFDAGSCIDGRLTSAWNWCSKLEKKPYYPVFKLAGFTSFDGDFQK